MREKIDSILIVCPGSEIKIIKEGRVIMPLNITFEAPRMPLSMAMMAGGLLNLARVEIIDAVNENLSRESIDERMSSFKPDLVIVNCSTPTLEDDINVIKDARSKGSLTATFGQHIDTMHNEVMEDLPELDFCFTCEPEIVAREFLKAWKDDLDLSVVKGLVFRNNGHIVTNEKQDFVPLEEFPKPARQLLKNELYELPDGELFTSVLASRGCSFNCPFCIAPPYHGRVVRTRDPESLVREVESVYKEYGITSFLFQSDLFTGNKEWVHDVCNRLKGLNIKGLRWITNTRFDNVDEETLRVMKEAGCFLLAIGIESGSPKMLKILGKSTDTSKIKDMLSICRRLGIKTNGSFVVGYPGETLETLKETEDLVMQLPLDFAVFMCATPFPGTRAYDEIIKSDAGYSIEKDWKSFCYYDYVINGGLTEDEVKGFSKRMFNKYFFSMHYFLLHIRDLKHPIRLFKTILYAFRRLPRIWVD